MALLNPFQWSNSKVAISICKYFRIHFPSAARKHKISFLASAPT